MKILGTGLSGLIGSRIVELLSPKHSFVNLSKETGFDITHFEQIRSHIRESSAPWVFHLAAKTDVDRCENERDKKEESEAWMVNVEATANIAKACRESGKKLLYVSTDYVFDGTSDFYTEADPPAPAGWYAMTKYQGEARVAKLSTSGLIIRIANPYGAKNTGKTDFLHKIMERFEKGLPVEAPDDQIFVPTFIDDIAKAIGLLVDKNAHGLFHVVGSQALSPYEAAGKIARVFGYQNTRIGRKPFREYFSGRAPRPFHAYLKNGKITQLGAYMRTFDEGLDEVRRQTAGPAARTDAQ